MTNSYFWQGDKVRLRAAELQDAEMKWKERFDTEARRNTESTVELPLSFEDYTASFSLKNAHFHYLSIVSLTDELVGWVTLWEPNQKDGNFTLGIGIFREYRHQGYATDALRIMLRYGFYEMRLHKCNSGCIETNIGSIKLHKKLGFIEEGRRRQSLYTNGRYYDELMFGLTRDEFDESEKKI